MNFDEETSSRGLICPDIIGGSPSRENVVHVWSKSTEFDGTASTGGQIFMMPNRLFMAFSIGAALTLGCDRPLPPSVFRETTDVVVAKPVLLEVTDYEEFTGHTEAIRSVLVRSQVTGYLKKRHFLEGEEVLQGDLLYEIDDRPYKAELDRANATVAQYEARRRRLVNDQRRSANLFQRGAIGKAEFDLVTSDLAEAEAMLNAALAQLEQARIKEEFTKVRAPMNGEIGRSLLEPGNLILEGTTILTDIVEADKLHVYFDINQDLFSKVSDLIRDGQVRSEDGKDVPVAIGLPDEEDYSYRGTLNFSENKVDSATGTLRVRGIMDNPKPWILSPGLFVRVKLSIGSPHPALLVPEAAVGSDQGRTFVYVVDDQDEVVYKPVRAGQVFEGKRSILQGLEADERVIVAGLQRVRPGSKVSPKMPVPSESGQVSALLE
ncbi:efflux RND transporter periplasmic adaptor subunit [Tundrisphaera lichenicola]|uniref:efflux RND transporter periplasmic adaptor subunit n=1 Tax=Tundrisphaera lichenicola TaxID=2029860 RepID=UPI003EC12B2D